MRSRLGSYVTELLGLAVLIDRLDRQTLGGLLGDGGVSSDGETPNESKSRSSFRAPELHFDMTRQFSVTVTRAPSTPPRGGEPRII